ncbi:MAG TPA: SurA N-terminal domain-containing protein [Terriglobales bacterium]|nr:SurA N-terminal domain-containing protein [Terriglobales bacterium]
MKTRFQLALVVTAFGLAVPALSAQQVVDRIVATVNNSPITQRDCEMQLRYEALVEGQAVSSTTLPPEVLDRVIDQELLRQQMKGQDLSVPETEVDAKVAEIRRQTADSDVAWRAALKRDQVSEGEVRDRVAVQLAVLRFVEQRLRSSVHVDPKAVETYYRETFLPQLREQGATEVPLKQVEGKIEEILAQRQMDQTMSAWLQDLRRQAEVRILLPGSATGEAVAAGTK